MADDSFLTPLQRKVLEMREGGMTQSDIARELETSRANVCIAEKRARENITKARRTLDVAESIGAPLRIVIEEGTDLFDVPREVFTQATKMGIKVRENSLSLMDMIRDKASDRLSGREVRTPIRIAVLSDGRVLLL